MVTSGVMARLKCSAVPRPVAPRMLGACASSSMERKPQRSAMRTVPARPHPRPWEHRVADEQAPAARITAGLGLQIRHVIVAVDHDLRPALAAAVNNAGMVQLVAENHVAPAAEGRDHAHIGHIAGIEQQRGLRTLERRQASLQLAVQFQAARGQAGAARARAPGHERFGGPGFDPRVIGQAQIVVGGQQEQLPAFTAHAWTGGRSHVPDMTAQAVCAQALQAFVQKSPLVRPARLIRLVLRIIRRTGNSRNRGIARAKNGRVRKAFHQHRPPLDEVQRGGAPLPGTPV